MDDLIFRTVIMQPRSIIWGIPNFVVPAFGTDPILKSGRDHPSMQHRPAPILRRSIRYRPRVNCAKELLCMMFLGDRADGEREFPSARSLLSLEFGNVVVCTYSAQKHPPTLLECYQYTVKPLMWYSPSLQAYTPFSRGMFPVSAC